ncbi:hypothetical protein EDD16DRAFT_1131459 [Pisolithus croceorrhizus]|nr:hypothetical protein EDD16DRAFT_1131459 [Pisolithus croceorrhizus]KAI6134368.1 hypothetical protein EV401DRAFT_2064108 [Pisolithus croceorrhizus]KAI6146500.1 hypothetical protein EDD17DRAFT_1767646 [Pisolithus thermaeus]
MSSVTDPEATLNAFVNTIRPNFDYIVVTTAFSACTFTLFVVLFALSTKESRHHLAFRLNVLAICVVLIMSILTGLTNGKAVVDPFNPVSTSVYLAAVVLTVFPPLLYDSILLTRLFALYPLSSTPLKTLLKIFAFPLCVKCTRVVVLTLFLNEYIRTAKVEGLAQGATTTWFRNPSLMTEWAMQIADNLYSVSFFLYKLHVRTRLVKRRNITERIHRIFYIAVANFVFPLIVNVALIISIMTDPSMTTGASLMLVNNYVTIMGVMCATLWFSGSEWVRTRDEPLPDPTVFNSLKPCFEGDHVAGGGSKSSIVFVVGKGSVASGTPSLDTGMGPKQLTIPEKEDMHTLV